MANTVPLLGGRPPLSLGLNPCALEFAGSFRSGRAIFTVEWLLWGLAKDYGKAQITVGMATTRLATINGLLLSEDVYLQP